MGSTLTVCRGKLGNDGAAATRISKTHTHRRARKVLDPKP
jgi:hypothetical protein